MDHHAAGAHYYVDLADVQRLRSALGEHLHLMVTRIDGDVAAAALNTEFGGIVQAHLIGINPELRSLSPQKVLTDDLRRWGHSVGASVLHLGGGVGGAEDSLFAFKKRFSDRRHDFHTGRWVLDPDAYAELARGAAAGDVHPAAGDARTGEAITPASIATGFFPAYRAPAPRRLSASD